MPDSERALNLIIDSTFNPKGAYAARQAIDRTERSFRDMTKVVSGKRVARSIEDALKPLEKMQAVSPLAAAGMQQIGGEAVKNAQALGGITDELRAIDQATAVLKGQYAGGLLSGKQLKEGVGQLRGMRHEIMSMSADEYKAAVQRRQAWDDMESGSKRATEAMKKHYLTEHNMVVMLQDYNKGVGTLMSSLNMSYKEASEFAEDFTKHMAFQQVQMEETVRASKQMASGMGFLGAVKQGFTNIGKDLMGAVTGAGGTLLKLPRKFAEGVKDHLGAAFSSRPITRALQGVTSKMFSMRTLKNTALFGPLGFIGSMLTGGKKKDRFASAAEKEGPLGGLGKTLLSFGGIIKTAFGAFAPAALLFKALEPALRTLLWAIEPLLAPLQQMLSDVVLSLVPFFAELSKEFVVLADTLLPPIVDLFNQLMPIFMELIRAILPPLTEMLKITLRWIGKLTSVLGKVLVPVISWVGDQLVWVADKVGGAIEWLISGVADALSWLGFDVGNMGKRPNTESAAMGTEPGAAAMAAAQPRAMPGVNVQGRGVAGELEPLTIGEAGGTEQYLRFSRERETADPLHYLGSGQLAAGRRDLTAEAIREAIGDKPDVVSREQPEKASEPVVKSIEKMTDRLLTFLPKKIGEETKSITLSNFGAVTA